MAKNIVICCDGTGNEVEENLSNVLKLYRTLKKNDEQVVYYDPGIGTLGKKGGWGWLKKKIRGVWGLATGAGLDDNVIDAYRFLIRYYQSGDQVYLFGFSRGAYTARVLAGFIRSIGLMRPDQFNLLQYAFTAYKQAAEKNDFEIAWRFQRVTGAEHIPIKFVGVWDTVSSMFVPRPDRLYFPSMQSLPYTKTNDLVEVFRHAIAIDELRTMFRAYEWNEPQVYKSNPFSRTEVKQDIKQVWFAGVHSDVGGGYPETESGLAKFPLKWMIDEAVGHGLLVNTAMVNHLVLGHERKGGSRHYVAPDATAEKHNSLGLGWRILEIFPKPKRKREWAKRPSFAGLYLPLSEPRRIPDGAFIHQSVIDRITDVEGYNPPNVPEQKTIVS